jgi:hypothetical protein
VFARPCPHAIAAQREAAAQAWSGGERRKAISLMRDVCKDSPGEPRYRLELGDFLAAGDPLERVEALALWASLAIDDETTASLRADAYDRLARNASANGDLERTRALVALARKLPADPNAKRQVDAQWLALEHVGPAGPALRGYFFAPAGALEAVHFALLATLAEPDLGIGHYLLGLQKYNDSEWRDAAKSLALSLDKGLPSLAFVKNAARRLAVAAYRAGDRAGLARALAALRQPGMSVTDHLLADDWEQRLEFAATGRLSKRLHTGEEQPTPAVPLED